MFYSYVKETIALDEKRFPGPGAADGGRDSSAVNAGASLSVTASIPQPSTQSTMSFNALKDMHPIF